MTIQASAGRRLRDAIAEERPLQVVGAINAYFAMLAERSGYNSLYLSGAGVKRRVILTDYDLAPPNSHAK